MRLFRPLKKIVMILTIAILTTACNEEAFYKQDHLEALNNPDYDLPQVLPNDTDFPGETSTSGPSVEEPPVVVLDPPLEVGDEFDIITEQFTQNAEAQKKIDILWVIDDSGSMGNEQEALARNFDAFINDFIQKDIDFKMAITTTDTTSAEKKGLSKAPLDFTLTSEAAKDNEAQFLNDFKEYIKVGITGSGWEKGLYGSLSFLDRYKNEGYFRDDALLSIVYVSDEQDQSFGSVQSYIDDIAGHKESLGLVKVFSIITDEDDTPLGSGYYGSRYKEASQIVGGSVSSITGDFHQILSDMGNTISQLADSFSLAGIPDNSETVEVYVEGQKITEGYQYDAETRSVLFLEGYVPESGLSIEIKYLVKK